MATFWMNVGWCIAGYVAAVFTWDKFHTFMIGAKTKTDQLRQQVRDLEAKIKAAL